MSLINSRILEREATFSTLKIMSVENAEYWQEVQGSSAQNKITTNVHWVKRYNYISCQK